jgi:predicted nuclease of predicted toxin-antitoxin system
MKLLLDSCVWGKAAQALRDAGHDVLCAADWPSDPGDQRILEAAVEGDRVVVTLDKDFGTLAFLKRQSHCGMIRLVDISATRQAMACLSAMGLYARELAEHAIVTVEPGRVRVRLPPAQGT